MLWDLMKALRKREDGIKILKKGMDQVLRDDSGLYQIRRGEGVRLGLGEGRESVLGQRGLYSDE